LYWICLGKTMIQIKDLSKNALCAGVKSPAVMQSLFTQTAPHIGFLIQFFPTLIISRVIQNKGVNMKGHCKTLTVIPSSQIENNCNDSERKSSSYDLKGSESAFIDHFSKLIEGG
jgi:hypothetical protein